MPLLYVTDRIRGCACSILEVWANLLRFISLDRMPRPGTCISSLPRTLLCSILHGNWADIALFAGLLVSALDPSNTTRVSLVAKPGRFVPIQQGNPMLINPPTDHLEKQIILVTSPRLQTLEAHTSEQIHERWHCHMQQCTAYRQNSLLLSSR